MLLGAKPWSFRVLMLSTTSPLFKSTSVIEPGDAIGSAFTLATRSLATKGLEADKLTDVERGMHDALLKAGAGSTPHYTPKAQRSLSLP
jgi:hypothetical protein